jgi:RNA polymerase sigma-70 factor (ECF subfamily)
VKDLDCSTSSRTLSKLTVMKLVPRPPQRPRLSSETGFVGGTPERTAETPRSVDVKTRRGDDRTERPSGIEPAGSNADPTPAPLSEVRLQTATVYDAYAPFVWRSLQRMGVPESDLDDALQEVFIVVHRKLAQYDAERAKLSTWLFGITLNIARKHRSRGRLTLGADLDATPCERPCQDTQLQRQQQAERLNLVLGKMRPEHSATFVMFELEGLSCQEIADLTGVPVGTVYSRLHKARDQFRDLVEKSEKAPSGLSRVALAVFGKEAR